jgi:hypothetical protein
MSEMTMPVSELVLRSKSTGQLRGELQGVLRWENRLAEQYDQTVCSGLDPVTKSNAVSNPYYGIRAEQRSASSARQVLERELSSREGHRS